MVAVAVSNSQHSEHRQVQERKNKHNYQKEDIAGAIKNVCGDSDKCGEKKGGGREGKSTCNTLPPTRQANAVPSKTENIAPCITTLFSNSLVAL